MSQATYAIEAQPRDSKAKNSDELRKSGFLPAVLYGKGITNQNLSISYSQFLKVYRQAGESSLIDVTIGSTGSVKTLVQDVAMDSRTDKIIHVDFYQVNMAEKLNATIPLLFTGEAKAVKELAGILVKSLSEIEVRCLPSDLVHEITVDLSPLATFEDTICVKDIVLPKGIEVLEQPDVIIATVTESISEEELAKLSEKPEGDIQSVQQVEKKKKEEDEPASK